MIHLSSRDINSYYNLTPEESSLKTNLMEEISRYHDSSIKEAWDVFYQNVKDAVDEVLEDYIKNILMQSEEYKISSELNKQWDSLPTKIKQGNYSDVINELRGKNMNDLEIKNYVKNLEKQHDELNDRGYEAEKEVKEVENELNKKYDDVRRAMISQVISWRVD